MCSCTMYKNPPQFQLDVWKSHFYHRYKRKLDNETFEKMQNLVKRRYVKPEKVVEKK